MKYYFSRNSAEVSERARNQHAQKEEENISGRMTTEEMIRVKELAIGVQDF